MLPSSVLRLIEQYGEAEISNICRTKRRPVQFLEQYPGFGPKRSRLVVAHYAESTDASRATPSILATVLTDACTCLMAPRAGVSVGLR